MFCIILYFGSQMLMLMLCLVTIQNRRRRGGKMLQSLFPHSVRNWENTMLSEYTVYYMQESWECCQLSHLFFAVKEIQWITQNVKIYFEIVLSSFFAFHWATQYKGNLDVRGDRDCCYQSESVLTFLFSKNADLILLNSICVFVVTFGLQALALPSSWRRARLAVQLGSSRCE